MNDPVIIHLLIEMKSSHNPRDYKSKLYYDMSLNYLSTSWGQEVLRTAHHCVVITSFKVL